jgi:UDP-2,3-diacylglucosamine hydrolase
MLGHTLVVVSDAHIGADSTEATDALLAFLEHVPALGDSLLVNGDLFEFWFSYRRAVPRTGFLVAAALAMLRRRLPVAMTGGNHDRWGHGFWRREADILYHPDELRFTVGRRRILAVHGDGATEGRATAAIGHRIITHPITEAFFGAIHPDLGLWLIDRLGPRLADPTTDPLLLERAQTRQRDWAERRLRADPDLDLVILSHTHRAEQRELLPGRHYLNPGAWVAGRRYAIVTEGSIEIRQWEG